MPLAKISGIAGIIWGLLVAIAGMLLSTILTSMMGRLYTGYQMMNLPVEGVASLIALPIAYGVTGFIAAYIGALVYNWIAKQFGGVKVDLV